MRISRPSTIARGRWASSKSCRIVITLTVFVPFAWLYLDEPPKFDYLWAALCLLGAVYFVFRSRWFGA